MDILQERNAGEAEGSYFGADWLWSAPNWGRGWFTFQVDPLAPNRISIGSRSRTKIMSTRRGCSLFFFSVSFSIEVD